MCSATRIPSTQCGFSPICQNPVFRISVPWQIPCHHSSNALIYKMPLYPISRTISSPPFPNNPRTYTWGVIFHECQLHAELTTRIHHVTRYMLFAVHHLTPAQRPFAVADGPRVSRRPMLPKQTQLQKRTLSIHMPVSSVSWCANPPRIGTTSS